jgi:arginase
VSVTVIGVPTDSAGRTDGVARSPAALRRAGLADGIATRSAVVTDAGDIRVDLPSGTRGPDGVIDGPALTTTLARTRGAVASARRRGDRVVLLGGDCPILLGGLAGCLEADGTLPALLFVDGHEDAWPPEASTTGEAADMELGWLFGRGVERLDPGLRAEIPRIEPARTAVLGPRDRAEIVAAGVEPLDAIVPVVDAAAVALDPPGSAIAALERIAPEGLEWWLHVDLDVLSTDALAAVDYQQPGGLSWSDLRALTSASIDLGGCIGATVTIYNPDLDPDGGSATTVAAFVLDVIDRLDASVPPAS